MTEPSTRRTTLTSRGLWAGVLAACSVACGEGGAAPPDPGSDGDAGAESCLRVASSHDEGEPYVYSVRWSPDGEYVLTGNDGEVRLLRPHTLEKIASYADQPSGSFLDVSPDSRFALAVSTDVRLLAVGMDPPSLTHLATASGHLGHIYAVGWSPEGDRALTGGQDGTVRLFSVDRSAGSLTQTALGEGHVGKVFGVAWSADGRHVVSGGQDRTLRLWSVEDGALRQLSFVTLNGWVSALAWRAGKPILTGTWAADNLIRSWSLDATLGTLTASGEFATPSTDMQVLEWSREGGYVAVGGHDDTISLFAHVEDRFEPIARLPLDGSGAHSVSWGPGDARLALAASRVNRVREIDLAACP